MAATEATASHVERQLDVVVRREPEEEPDSVFLIARGVAMIGLLGGSLMMCTKGVPTHPVLGALVLAGAMFSLWVSTKAPPRRMRLTTRPTSVRITPDAIAFEATTIRRSEISTAVFNPGDAREKPSVRCLDERGRIFFEALVENETVGTELLRELGHDPTRQRTEFPIVSPFGTTGNRRLATLVSGYGLLFLFFFLMPNVSALVFAALAVGLWLLPRLLMYSGGRIEIGLDGVLVRWMRTKRFVPYDAIEKVERSGNLVRIVRKDERAIVLNPGTDTTNLDALVARIESARRARTLPERRVELEERLGRGDRPVQAWRSDLGRLDEDDGYRDPGLRHDDLWRIVEDASAPEDTRVGAALVLRGVDEAAPRLRLAADGVASPKLRVALETAADPGADEAELDEKLAAISRR